MFENKLIIINGTMGVGKTTISKSLCECIKNSAWIDGDWCWKMNPWVVNEENKEMVEDNIIYILKSFLKNSSIEYIFFSWVLHKEEIFEKMLFGLKEFDFELYKITLQCSDTNLKERFLKDNRNLEKLKDSIEKSKMYLNLDSIKVNTDNKTISQITTEIIKLIT